jgi:RNA polymerase sigma-70 factor (ECF subfamily)
MARTSLPDREPHRTLLCRRACFKDEQFVHQDPTHHHFISLPLHLECADLVISDEEVIAQGNVIDGIFAFEVINPTSRAVYRLKSLHGSGNDWARSGRYFRMHELATSASRAEIRMARTPDQELVLIERVCSGETQLFYELICPYKRRVYVAAASVLQNEADAEDAAQEAFLKAFVQLYSFRRESKFSTWLIQIAVNEARTKRRKDHRFLYDSIDEKAEDEEGDYCPKDFADWRDTPSENLQRAELRTALRNAIASLVPSYREVFVMRDIQNLSIAETAEVLQISQAAVKTRLLRARLKVRDALAPGLDSAWSSGDGSWREVRPW